LTLIVDASVALKWVLEEPGSRDAIELLFRPMIAPSLFQAEVGHALTKRVRRAELAPEQARAGFAFIIRQCTLLPIEPLGDAALRLALELRHSLYDCYYLAAAEATGQALVTADGVLVAKLRAAGWAKQIYLLGEELPNG
jgi:predicted nucleic acid-binding protein